MALVACPECKQQVSTEAVSCPHCGKQLLGNTAAGPASVANAPAAFFVPGGSPSAEETLWEGRPSMALVSGKVVRLAIRLIIVFVVGYFAIAIGLPSLESTSSQASSTIEQNATYFYLGIVVVLALAVLPSLTALLQAIARTRNTHYRVSNQRIVIQSGVLARQLEEIDMRSIDDIEFHQSFIERLFGIGEVYIVSTDKVAPKLALHGIQDPLKVRELIRSTAYQVSQRQLFTRST
jgi:membrane protein YdbS with pleckstrin-like domain